MNTSSLLFERRGRVAVLTLNRPDALNALDLASLESLAAALESIRGDASIHGVIITGGGRRAFCAGADIRYLAGASAPEVRAYAQQAVEVNRRLETLGKPVVAALNGSALGGGLELAESCMLRIAARGAMLGHPEVKIGAVAGFGGTTRLARLVGRARAAEMLLRGRAIDAETALSVGLVHAVVDADRVIDEAGAWLGDILAQSRMAVQLTWEALHRGLDMPLDASAQLGADAFGLVAVSEDFREGTRAFLEKRPVDWRGH